MVGVPGRISIVTLGVADVARSTAFYEALGWQRSSSSQPAITFLHTVGSTLALFGRDDLAADAGVVPAGSGFRGVTLAINLESAAAVDDAFDAWVAAGGTAVHRPYAADWGGYSSYVADPDGHLWEIAHNPYFPLDADGRCFLPDSPPGSR
jgi:hypothetical protein